MFFNYSLLVSPEVPLVLYLFLLISLVWLWAGLHMGYKKLWMLILYVIFNCLLVSPMTYSSVVFLHMLANMSTYIHFIPSAASPLLITERSKKMNATFHLLFISFLIKSLQLSLIFTLLSA